MAFRGALFFGSPSEVNDRLPFSAGRRAFCSSQRGRFGDGSGQYADAHVGVHPGIAFIIKVSLNFAI